ncbi:MAG: SAM-dependent chlorinase/fluorinase [Desulfobacterales bacterium]|nr:SAM-dependent chlorinase/fluorinase [Desulfobacterales bacterium]
MAVITLLTDFGLTDEYVGVMKGVILSVNPGAVVVDITHGIAPQDVVQAAYTLKSSYHYFPGKTVHVVVVDPGVGGDRDIIALQLKNHVFLAPDNGVLTPLIEDEAPETLVRVTNRRFFPGPVSATFHGRDIFAPAAGHLSLGASLTDLGPRVNREDLIPLDIQPPTRPRPGEWVGAVITVDRFGNLITDIEGARLTAEDFAGPDAEVVITIGSSRIRGLSTTYGDAPPFQPLALIGSRGYLEIAMNQGDARRYFNAGRGDAVRVIAGGAGSDPPSE